MHRLGEANAASCEEDSGESAGNIVPRRRAIHLRDRFALDTKDPEWIGQLGKEGDWIIVSGDPFGPNVWPSRHQLGTKSVSGAPDTLEAPEKIGGPWRTRTSDPLIKSQLLYQLS